MIALIGSVSVVVLTAGAYMIGNDQVFGWGLVAVGASVNGYLFAKLQERAR